MIKQIAKKIIRYAKSPFILFSYLTFFKQKSGRFNVSLFDLYPCIRDKTIKTGFDRHYVYHTAWAARKVKAIAPEFHTDISSILFFSGIISPFVPVKFYDYRPAELVLENFESHKADLMALPFADNSVQSLSCMHVVEHVGLGRYGDPIDADGDLKSIKELSRVLAVGGSLLFVVPIGAVAKIEFNAHRIFTLPQIKEYFSDLELKEFTLIPEHSGEMIVHATEEDVAKESYACGCFWFTKK